MWYFITIFFVLWAATRGIRILFPHFSELTYWILYIIISIIMYATGNAIFILITMLHNLIFGITLLKNGILNGMHSIGQKNQQKHFEKKNKQK